MADISFDASSFGAAGPVTTMTIPHTITGLNPVLYSGILDDGGSNNVTNVTFNGSALTRIDEVVQIGSGYISLWGILNPSTGTHNIVYTMAMASNPAALNASYIAARQSGLPDAKVSQPGTVKTTTLGTLTSVADNCWTVMLARAQTAMTPEPGTTSRVNPFSSTFQIFDSNGPITPAGSTSLSFTTLTGITSFIMVSFAPFVTNVTTNPAFLTNLM